MEVLKKYKYWIAGILAVIGIILVLRNKPYEGILCSEQDNLVHEMQKRIQRDSTQLLLLERNSINCAKQSAEMIATYEKELKAKTKTIDLLKNSTFVLMEGLEVLQKRKELIDSTRLNRNDLQNFFNNYK